MSVQLQPSASSMPRLFLCLASGLLKQTEYHTAFADAGHERHAGHEEAIVAGDLSTLPSEVQALLEGMTVRAEVAVVYDVAAHTARELGTQLGRSYGTLKPFEIPGSMDALAISGRRGIVVDHKSFEFVDHPERNQQTLLYALAVALIYDLDEVTVVIWYTERPDMKPVVATLDRMDLDAYAEDVKQLYVRAGAAVNDPHSLENPGPKQCKYCRAFLDCNAQKKLAIDLQTDVVVSQFNSMIPFESDQDAADTHDLKDRVRLWLKRVEAALAAYAIDHPYRLNDGRMYGEIEKLGNKEIDGDKAYEYIREAYGQKLADDAVSREATQAGIERALRRAGLKQPNKLKEDIVSELDKRGGVTQKKKVELGYYDAQPQLKAGAK